MSGAALWRPPFNHVVIDVPHLSFEFEGAIGELDLDLSGMRQIDFVDLLHTAGACEPKPLVLLTCSRKTK
jgi:hypothetical protein